MPDRENGVPFPKQAVFGFLGEEIDRYAAENSGKVLDTFVSITKNYPVYSVIHNGAEIALCQAPVGAAASTQILDWLYARGVEKVLSTGSCGTLEGLPENAFFVPDRALRDEGTSYHYLPPQRYSYPDTEIQKEVKQYFNKRNIPFAEGATWSTDGFFRETAEKVKRRRDEGCKVVDMECSALCACAAFRKKKFGMFFYTADSLANVNEYDERNWGFDSLRTALEICLDILSVNK
ncbi:MAG: phosphorylase [Clostridiales bacterium]|nr:phosphorylase [Clostridiales bacterium]